MGEFVSLTPWAYADELLVRPRPDFVDQVAHAYPFLPEGEKWTLRGERDVLGVAGLEDQGGGQFALWAYLADLTPRQWAMAARLAWDVLLRVDRRKVRRLRVVPTPSPEHHDGAVRLLKRIGFVDVGEPYMVWEG